VLYNLLLTYLLKPTWLLARAGLNRQQLQMMLVILSLVQPYASVSEPGSSESHTQTSSSEALFVVLFNCFFFKFKLLSGLTSN